MLAFSPREQDAHTTDRFFAKLGCTLAEHQEKIRPEYEKDFPDEGLISHWETEIRAFDKGIQQALKRLEK